MDDNVMFAYRMRALTMLAVGWLCCCGGTCPAEKPTEMLIPRHADWKFLPGNAKPARSWRKAEFDDSAWRTVVTGIGYGDDDDATVLDEMQGQYPVVYLRRSFDLPEVSDVEAVHLYVNYDDGFIAYLNGERVASASVEERSGRLFVAEHEAAGFQRFQIDEANRFLRVGKNVLALEGYNRSLGSSDFSLDPFLARDIVASPYSTEEYLQDLRVFEKALEERASYLTLRQFDYQAALDALRNSIDAGTRLVDFASSLRKLVMQLGDCHADVRCQAWPRTDRFLPARLADTNEGVAALSINGANAIHPEFPFLESIDGVPLHAWLESASQFVPAGSPQLVRQRSLQWLGRIRLLREEMDLPESEIVTLGLRSSDGLRRTDVRRRLTAEGFRLAQVKKKPSRRLPGNIAYLRIATMSTSDDRMVRTIISDMDRVRDTRGLIIDVRDNTGGSYQILRAIYGFFVPRGAEPYVTNIARYRLAQVFSDQHLAHRPTHRVSWTGWSERERSAIRRSAADFRPQWIPSMGDFSDWHYMVLSRAQSGWDRLQGQSEVEFFYYDKPVVVLCNATSFSATDGFLSAFSDLPQVTLLGEASGGGSGSRRRFVLPNTRIDVSLSSMVSYRANGQLFDGQGIEVDVAVKPRLADFTSSSDSVLQSGISQIGAAESLRHGERAR